MSAKISEELARRIEEAEAVEPGREIPVIVTVAAGADLKALEQRGLRVERVFEIISAVSGTLIAAEARALAGVEQVEKIEYDGEVRAL